MEIKIEKKAIISTAFSMHFFLQKSSVVNYNWRNTGKSGITALYCILYRRGLICWNYTLLIYCELH